VIFPCFHRANVAVHTTAGCIQKRRHFGATHCFHDLVGEECAFPKVDIGLGCGASDIGVGSKVNHRVMTLQREREGVEIFHVAAHNDQSLVIGMVPVMPLTTG
jgi:hypothetical protein